VRRGSSTAVRHITFHHDSLRFLWAAKHENTSGARRSAHAGRDRERAAVACRGAASLRAARPVASPVLVAVVSLRQMPPETISVLSGVRFLEQGASPTASRSQSLSCAKQIQVAAGSRGLQAGEAGEWGETAGAVEKSSARPPICGARWLWRVPLCTGFRHFHEVMATGSNSHP